MPLFETLARRVYLAVAEVTWATLALAVVGHAFVSWLLLALAGEGRGEGALAGDAVTFLYFYVTTATTVGYGDLSPAGALGRLAAALWVLPGAIALFAALLGKTAQEFGRLWRRRMDGAGDYGSRTGHTVVLGWQGARTQRLIELLLADQPPGERIVLVAKSLERNPMPDALDFVRADALSTPRGGERAGLGGARSIVVRGEDDDETLAATLAASTAAPGAHIVAHFEDERAAELIARQCPAVEAIGSLSAELLVRASRDPGASRVADLLFSAKTADTAFSLTVPALPAPVRYLDALVGLKRLHDVTVLGVGEGHGDAVDLNCAADAELREGQLLYYVADRRVGPGAIDWSALATELATETVR